MTVQATRAKTLPSVEYKKYNLRTLRPFMKTINYLATKMFAGAVALAIVSLAPRATAENIPQLITVIKVDGQARYSTDNKTWHTLKRGDVLMPGSVIQTAEKSTADILMGEKLANMTPTASRPSENGIDTGPKANVLHIYESSVLAIDKLIVDRTGVDEVAETQLDLRAGQIMGNVKKLAAASRYEVKIPNGVAGIRGTTFVVSATGTVYVLTGQVIISYVGAGGQLYTKTISAGNSFNPFNADGTPGNGTTAPIPPATLIALQHVYGTIPTPVTIFTKPNAPNSPVIHISPD